MPDLWKKLKPVLVVSLMAASNLALIVRGPCHHRSSDNPGRSVHNFTAAPANEWTLEAWTDGCALRGPSAVTISLRLTTSDPRVSTGTLKPQVRLALREVNGTAQLKQLSYHVEFREEVEPELIGSSYYLDGDGYSSSVYPAVGKSWRYTFTDAFDWHHRRIERFEGV